MNLDPIDQAVISQGLVASAREMGVKLIRSAYSTILREASDGSAALLDRHGNVVAQAELIPMQLGPLGATFRPCAETVPPDELEEGDFYINNSPFEGGQHLPDVFIFSPIFFDRTLVGFSASVAHHLDLGGGAPGMNPDATDVHQEGLILPPSRYNMERDWNGGPFERLIAANIRVPELTIGDFNAQFAAKRHRRRAGEAALRALWRGNHHVRHGLPSHLFRAAHARGHRGDSGRRLSRRGRRRRRRDQLEAAAHQGRRNGRRRRCRGRFRRDRRPGAAQPELPLRFDGLGRLGGGQGGGQLARHPVQPGSGEADNGDGPLRQPAQSQAAGTGAGAHDPRLPGLRRGREGVGQGRSGQGHRHRVRHDPFHLHEPAGGRQLQHLS